MKVYITARALYAVETNRYIIATFASLLQANSFIRQQGSSPIYTWLEV